MGEVLLALLVPCCDLKVERHSVPRKPRSRLASLGLPALIWPREAKRLRTLQSQPCVPPCRFRGHGRFLSCLRFRRGGDCGPGGGPNCEVPAERRASERTSRRGNGTAAHIARIIIRVSGVRVPPPAFRFPFLEPIFCGPPSTSRVTTKIRVLQTLALSQRTGFPIPGPNSWRYLPCVWLAVDRRWTEFGPCCLWTAARQVTGVDQSPTGAADCARDRKRSSHPDRPRNRWNRDLRVMRSPVLVDWLVFGLFKRFDLVRVGLSFAQIGTRREGLSGLQERAIAASDVRASWKAMTTTRSSDSM